MYSVVITAVLLSGLSGPKNSSYVLVRVVSGGQLASHKERRGVHVSDGGRRGRQAEEGGEAPLRPQLQYGCESAVSARTARG